MLLRDSLPGTVCLRNISCSAVCLLLCMAWGHWSSVTRADDVAPATGGVSYHKEVRPLFQAHCQGCHQPSKKGGDYDMTSFASLLKGGESGAAAIVPGKPDSSYLFEQIAIVDGQAAMPKGKPALHEKEIAIIRKWIAEGAKDDTPASAGSLIDVDHPPVYTRPPIITSLAFSPDGSLLAVAGFHEVLIHKADGSGLVTRLIGVSERIEKVTFSADGTRLAVAGGNPDRMGELQVWGAKEPSTDPTKWGLQLSIPTTFDTIYGAAWSPDGSLIAVGCSDNIVRGFDSTTGEQKFFNGAHSDWPLDTVFSVDGSQIVSVGRDMATKLYDVKTERFIDNVTSITPGALKGGISAVARHPMRDEVLVGGSDGVPRIYRMNRITKRVIGDDANLIRRFPAMRGRIFGAAFAPDGKSIACISSLDGKGQLFTFATEFDSAMPADISGIVQKVVTSQSADEKKRLEEWLTSDVKVLQQVELPTAPFAVAFTSDGQKVAVAGTDGTIRFVGTADGVIQQEFNPVTVTPAPPRTETMMASGGLVGHIPEDEDGYSGDEPLPTQGQVTSLVASAAEVSLQGPGAYTQLMFTANYSGGEAVDVTRLSQLSVEQGDSVSVNKIGRVLALKDGVSTIQATFGGQTVRVQAHVAGFGKSQPVRFITDVNPVLSRVGCNAGTCHGAKDGKEGFKLSLRGYDPLFDIRAFTDDLKSRRTNIASPDDSLMLMKATAAVPHVGGQLMKPGHPYYETIRQWIAEGAMLDLDVPRVVSISIEPEKPVIASINGRQQMRVVASYSDGSTRDVTREAYIESGNTEVAVGNRVGIMTGIRRGEAPVMARFEGAYAAATVTVMGDRSGYTAEPIEAWNEIDNLVAAKWQRMKIVPSGLCTDDEFLRRVYLDLTGLPPTVEQVRAFLSDPRPSKEKRDAMVDSLIGSEEYVTYWTNKWADLLQVNRKFLGPEGAMSFRKWIRDQVAANRPYDEFCYDILTATGSNKENPPASYYKILRDPDVMMENTTHLFLAVRFNCNKCHDHPFERWTQDQYYETAAFFAQTSLSRDPKNKDGNIGGTAVEGAKPLWEVVSDQKEGEMKHDRTGAVTPPLVPYDRQIATDGMATRREALAKWITSPDNDYFAKSYVNRVWGYLLGIGLIEPLDDIRAGNPATNPELLSFLETKFVESDFNVQELMRQICKSRTYQLSVGTNPLNEDDHQNYSHAVPKRLPAEVLYDAVYTVTGARFSIPGVPAGTRAAALPDVGVELSDNFLANLGRPVRESACECERSHDLQLGPVMALMNGPTVSGAISQGDNAIAKLVQSESDDAKVIDELFLRILNRSARPSEVAAAKSLMEDLKKEHVSLVAELTAYQQKIAPTLAAKEATRQAGIDAAQGAYDAHWATVKDKEEAATKAHADRLAAAKHAVDEYTALIPEKLAKWEASVSQGGTVWTPLDPENLKSNLGVKFTKESDLSVWVTGPNNKQGNYTLEAKTELANVTGIKLELLSDPRLPSNGPGRSPNGNFVLTEFTVQAAGTEKGAKPGAVKLINPKADFSQDGYSIASAIDGKQDASGNGWATHPETGKNRTATFEVESPVAREGGSKLFFTLDQKYQGKDHTIGRFRISVTDATPPLSEGLADNILAVLKVPVAERTDEQKKTLVDFYSQQDGEISKRQKELAEAQKPRVEDAHLVELRGKLDEAKLPLPVDPQLARLQRAVELSESQLKNERLTVAQDVAWALINSPAFLFNR
ncbi:MAG: DUF1553 domain-containing protein [Planctomycetaceae bacterium]